MSSFQNKVQYKSKIKVIDDYSITKKLHGNTFLAQRAILKNNSSRLK